MAAARQKIASGQGELDLPLPDSLANSGGPVPITGSRIGVLVGVRSRASFLKFPAADLFSDAYQDEERSRIWHAAHELQDLINEALAAS